MRFWFDTEFFKDGRVIDLISIGVVAEDGREYYAETLGADNAVHSCAECAPGIWTTSGGARWLIAPYPRGRSREGEFTGSPLQLIGKD